jgi:hypothetical protein
MVLVTILVMAKIQQRARDRLLVQQRAEDRAREMRQQEWKEQQEMRFTQLEERLMAQMNSLLEEMHTNEIKYIRSIDDVKRQYEAAFSQVRLEYMLVQLPRIEDMPLSGNTEAFQTREEKKNHQLSLPGADLSKRDLSHRCLSHANLEKTSLSGANLFMTDLSGANLAGADLSQANLAAANLVRADLHNANLEGANLLVADLDDANLCGTNLCNTRNLTAEQLQTAITSNDVHSVEL